jgi:hypothetical protein
MREVANESGRTLIRACVEIIGRPKNPQLLHSLFPLLGMLSNRVVVDCGGPAPAAVRKALRAFHCTYSIILSVIILAALIARYSFGVAARSLS